MQLFYAIGLLIAFYFVLIAEFFLPTGGFLGTVAVAILVAAVAIAFSHSTVAGITMIVVVVLTTPLFLIGMLRIWPHTAIGRRMLNRRPMSKPKVRTRRTRSRPNQSQRDMVAMAPMTTRALRKSRSATKRFKREMTVLSAAMERSMTRADLEW